MVERTYSIDEVTRFCEITGDPNSLHNAEFMARQGKYPIIPGMMVWASAAGLSPSILEEPSNIEVYFGDAAHPKERLKFECSEAGELRVLRENKNLLQKENPSSMKPTTAYLQIEPQRMLEVEVEDAKVQAYQALMRINHPVSSLLYAMTTSSSALCAAIRNPQTAGERVVLEALREQLPMFTELHFYTAGNLPQPGSLNFGLEMGKNGKGLVFHLTCDQNANPIYTACFKARPVSMDLLVKRVAKNLPKIPV